ncbi:hypothetical protein EHS25_000082 [Saitozyma podzolica]|uniref:Uncharacterized protein n=1 Tax=Saitozyma podzolica TaxID=1890683 RepID=A0A427YV79_9TREE|nr:hypothetical protein EHS25_000082 [Saitozyma podzolica]
MSGPDRRPLSEDALNRFRITHPDRDLRPLLRRLHRLPHLSKTSPNDDAPNTDDSSSAAEEHAREREMVRMEVYKWRAGIERVMGSAANLGRQREVYLRRAEETAARTEQLRETLLEEKALLGKKLRERDHRLQCDEVAKRIIDKGRSRQQLDEQIALLQQELSAQASSHAIFVQTAQDRAALFSRIGPIASEVIALRLPESANEEKMDVDESSPPPLPSSSKLSAAAMPFQPGSKGSSSRGGTPAPNLNSAAIPAASGPASASHRPSSSSDSSRTGTSATTKYVLPARPSRPNAGGSSSATSVPPSRSASGRTQGMSSLPARPSALRSSTTPAAAAAGGRKGQGGPGLEEGEVGGDEEDGEVAEVAEKSKSTRSARGRK